LLGNRGKRYFYLEMKGSWELISMNTLSNEENGKKTEQQQKIRAIFNVQKYQLKVSE